VEIEPTFKITFFDSTSALGYQSLWYNPLVSLKIVGNKDIVALGPKYGANDIEPIDSAANFAMIGSLYAQDCRHLVL